MACFASFLALNHLLNDCHEFERPPVDPKFFTDTDMNKS